MQMTGNILLITGGGTGIGRGLAEAFQARGNQVIIAGRRQEVLEEVVSANPGMKWMTLDIESAESVKSFAAQLERDFPALNAVIHNAGIMRDEDLREGSLEAAEATIATNLLGPIRLNATLLPRLLEQPRATILTVTSGIAFVPKAGNPSYGATKAALHSYTQSLRYQLEDTPIQVIELVPPFVQTELQGPQQAINPNAMPLEDYLKETLHLLETMPDATEILVERVKPQRFAEARGEYDTFFKRYNDAVSGRAPR